MSENIATPPDDSSVALLSREIDCLRANLDSWPKKSASEKAALKETLVDDFLKDRKIDGVQNPWARKFLIGKLGTWMSNHTATRDSRLPKALKMVWTGREVFNLEEDGPVAERIKELCKAGKVKIAVLNIARSELWNALTPEEQAQFEEKADEWTEDGPDPELRALIAEKRLGDWIQSFVLWVHDQCGGLGQFEFFVLDKVEEMVHGVHDISMIWHAGDRAVPTYDEWRVKRPNRSWQDYCHACYHPDEHENDPDAPRATLPPHQFQFFDDGTPILPPLQEFRHANRMSAVLHAFLSLHWVSVEAASGIKKQPVAWQAVAKDTGRFLPPHALPEGFVFQNPNRMAAEPLKELWEHILTLQTSECAEERFHWTHWWERVGQSGEVREATYGRAPQPKHIAQPTKKKGSHARTKRAPPKGVFGLNKPDAASEDGTNSTDENAPRKEKGAKKTRRKAKESRPTATANKEADPKGKAKRKTTTVWKGKGKGKAKARADDDSVSAVSSDLHTNSDEEIELELQSEGSPATTVDEDMDGFGLDDLQPTIQPDGLDSDGKPIPGPSQPAAPTTTKRTVKPRPVRKVPHAPEASPNRPTANTPGLNAPKPVVGPWDDAPVGPRRLAKVKVPPRRAAVEAAALHPPSYVENDPERVFPYLWALNTEADFRNFLASWRHMMRHGTHAAPQFRRRAYLRHPDVYQWANWDSDCWGVPGHLHVKKESWASVLEWISVHAPSPVASASEVQQWALVVGLALRDIYVVNTIEPEEPIDGGAPSYLRDSHSALRDAIETILPLCITSQHPGGEIAEAPGMDPEPAVPLSRKNTRIVGKRGKPPGVRQGTCAVMTASISSTAAIASMGSVDEVERAVTAAVGSSKASSAAVTSSISAAMAHKPSNARRIRELQQCYVELTVTPSRRSTTLSTHQGPPSDHVPQVIGSSSRNAPPVNPHGASLRKQLGAHREDARSEGAASNKSEHSNKAPDETMESPSPTPPPAPPRRSTRLKR
ncbi:hypothetical protein C8T65DRAFT_699347 [Cerioporus squamosus]|nr:hypothetical protein C8T65DRAFT_699347 [Cerioporus squamosus]